MKNSIQLFLVLNQAAKILSGSMVSEILWKVIASGLKLSS